MLINNLNTKIKSGRPPWMYIVIKVQQKSDAPDFIRTRFYFKDLFYKDIYKCSEGAIGVRRSAGLTAIYGGRRCIRT